MQKLQYHLGSMAHHTVFEAELVGLLLGLQLIKTERAGRTSYTLGADNQAALSAVATPSNRSGHYLAEIFLTTAASLRKGRGTANYSLTLRWTAGHVNIKGNEEADKEAKLAAEGATSEPHTLPKILKKPLKYSKSAAKQEYKTRLMNTWRKEWSKSPRAHRLKHIDSSLPSSKFLKLTSDPKIPRKGTSWLFQLRTGHLPLNVYLHRFKRVDSAHCPACGFHAESPQYFLLDCPAYAHERWPLLTGLSPKDKEYASLIGHAKNAIPIIEYIQASGRFAIDNTRRIGAVAAAGGGRGREGGGGQ
jgi:ribonuclease HI